MIIVIIVIIIMIIIHDFIRLSLSSLLLLSLLLLLLLLQATAPGRCGRSRRTWSPQSHTDITNTTWLLIIIIFHIITIIIINVTEFMLPDFRQVFLNQCPVLYLCNLASFCCQIAEPYRGVSAARLQGLLLPDCIYHIILLPDCRAGGRVNQRHVFPQTPVLICIYIYIYMYIYIYV